MFGTEDSERPIQDSQKNRPNIEKSVDVLDAKKNSSASVMFVQQLPSKGATTNPSLSQALTMDSRQGSSEKPTRPGEAKHCQYFVA